MTDDTHAALCAFILAARDMIDTLRTLPQANERTRALRTLRRCVMMIATLYVDQCDDAQGKRITDLIATLT